MTQERAFTVLKDLLQSDFPHTPPEIKEKFTDSPMLTKIADMSKIVLQIGINSVLGEERMNIIDLAFRHLFNEYVENVSSTIQIKTPLQSPNKEELQQLRQTVLAFESENKELKDRVRELEEHAQNCQAELESAGLEKEKVLQSNVLLTAKRRDEISTKNAEILNLQDQLIGVQSELRISQDKFSRLTSHNKDLEDEITKLNAEKLALHDKSKQKTQLIRELRQEIDEFKQLSIEYEKTKTELANANKKQAIEDTYKMASAQLRDVVKNLNEEILPLRKNRDAALVLLQKQMLIINGYDKALEMQDDKIRILNAKIADLEDDVNEKDEIIQEHEDNTEELEDLRRLVMDCTEMLQSQFLITADQLPEAISQLMNSHKVTSREVDLDTNIEVHETYNYSAIIDSLTRFCLSLLNGKIDLTQFKSDLTPIEEDANLKLDAMTKISAIRDQFVRMDDNNEVDPILSILNKKNFNIVNKSELSTALIVTNVASKVSESSKKALDALLPAKRALNVICSNDELPSIVTSFILDTKNELEKLAKKVSSVVHLDTESMNEIDAISSFIDISTNLINETETKIRPVLAFAGKLNEIPSQVGPFVEKVRKDEHGKHELIIKEHAIKMREMANKLAESKSQIEFEQDRVRKLAYEVKNLFAEISKLKKQLAAAVEAAGIANDKADMEHAENVSLLEKQSQSNDVIKTLQSEVKRLEQQIKERSEANERRILALLDNERQAKFDELDTVNRRHKAEIQDLQREVSAKGEKVTMYKQQLQKAREDRDEVERALRFQITELEQENEATIRMAEENDVICMARIDELVKQNAEYEKQLKKLAEQKQRMSPALKTAFRTDKNIQTDAVSPSKIASADKWHDWASDIVAKRIIGRQRRLTDEELMSKISDTIYNIGSQKRLIQIIDDLRAQKAAFSAAQSAKKSTTFSLCGMISAVLFVRLAKKNSSALQRNSVITPRASKYPALQRSSRLSSGSTPNSSPMKSPSSTVIVL